LDLEDEAVAVERAVDAVLDRGFRTPDIAADGSTVTTQQMGDAVVEALLEG
jgi:3-isopropylmalate dehydrogenase